jgi:hypothetical protein
LAYQPPASSTFLSQQISRQQPASSTFLSEQTSTSHQPPAKRTGSKTIQMMTIEIGSKLPFHFSLFFPWRLEIPNMCMLIHIRTGVLDNHHADTRQSHVDHRIITRGGAKKKELGCG